MNQTKKDTKARKWLENFRNENNEIEIQIERLVELELELAENYQDEDFPEAATRVSHELYETKTKNISELEQEIKSLIESQQEKRRKIENVIMSSIYSPTEKAVIRLRYIDRKRWKDVCDFMFGSCKDYEEKQESYMRRIFMTHNSAMDKIEQYLEQNGD